MVLLQSDPSLCPRLLDYIVIVGARNPNRTGAASQTPEILRRYPPQDHSDFPLPPDVVFFCQPEGCFSSSHRRLSMREVTSFVFTLTEKDSGRVRYGICLNFYRPIERRGGHHNGISGGSRHNTVERTESTASTSSSEAAGVFDSYAAHGSPRAFHHQGSQQGHKPRKNRPRTHTLTSICLISHHPFFSKFRQVLHVMKRIIERCHDRSKGVSKSSVNDLKMKKSRKFTSKEYVDTVWGLLSGISFDCTNSLVIHDVREIETWILRLLSAPVPVPGKTRVNLVVLPETVYEPLIFALPDRTRLSLVDFPLHLPLELLGVETCLQVLICIMLEQKVVLQSRDYNSLTMSVMAFVAMLYPLQYMFPVIPLLPTCMTDAEQLLLAPTPFIIGIPASFLLYKKFFKLPNDVWLVDLDACKVIGPAESVPELPEPENTNLKNHLRQALTSMSSSPQPIHDLDSVANNPEFWKQRESMTNVSGFNPLIYGNDVDSIDVATRVAMVRFLNSSNMLANFSDHTRNLRFYPRPVVAFQYYSFIKSRPQHDNLFVKRFARTQAVEYFGEWCLYPDNLVFQRIQTGIFDPLLIGDKPKWYSQTLEPVEFRVCRIDNCTIHHQWSEEDKRTSDVPTDLISSGQRASSISSNGLSSVIVDIQLDESGSDSDGLRSVSSSYSSLNDFVTEMIDSRISGEAPEVRPELQKLTVDLSVFYSPPKDLLIPDFAETAIADTSSSDDDFEYKSTTSRLSDTRSSSPVHRDEKPKPAPKGSRLERQSSSLSRPPRPPPPTRVGSIGSHPGTPKSSASRYADGPSTSDSTSTSTRLNDYGSNTDDQTSGKSILSNIGDDLSDAAAQATHVFSELLGNKPNANTKQASKPYLPLGNRKALVEKQSLAMSAIRRRESLRKQYGNFPTPAEQQKNNTINSDNQVFLKDVVKGICDGKGVSLLQRNKVKKLMEDENYRAFVASKLNPNFDTKVSDPDAYISDICVDKYQIFKGLVYILNCMIAGLQTNCMTRSNGGMSSVFCLLEIAHTHYHKREYGGSSRSDTSQNSSPFGSQESLARKSEDNQFMATVSQPLYFDGEEYENIDVAASVPSAADSSDLLRDIVLKKGASPSPGTTSPQPSSARASLTPNSTGELSGASSRTLKSEFLNGKSKCAGAHRYNVGQMIQVPLTDEQIRANNRTYIFEALVNRDRSRLWDNMQFWEDAFLDTVAQEREIVGMDLSPGEMIERYTSLGMAERKRLEADEDRLLGIILYNMIAFMVMMRVEKTEIRKKVRRLVAKSHIGLTRSQEIYNLLDTLENLNGNSIDLRPLTSRFMQKQAFTVHRGSTNSGEMLFMEVCDDCIVLRSVMSFIVERWWFEKIVTASYSPKTRVLSLWVKDGHQTVVNQFYTKRCKELYNAVDEAIERAKTRAQDKVQEDGAIGRDFSGKFPVQDIVSGDSGLLQVCMDGIGLFFQNNKFFIELSHIKSCCTQKDDVFHIEYWDPKFKEMKHRKFASKMSKPICYSVLSSMSSYLAQNSAAQTQSLNSRTPVVSLPTDTITSTATVHASLAHS